MKKKLFFAIILLCGKAFSADWPCWRGPDSDGIAKKEKWNPSALNAGLKTVWKAEIGNGYSAVSIKDGKVYTMGNKNNKDIIYCLDEKTGETIWKYSYVCPAGDYPGPRATPVISGKNLFTFSRQGDLHCIDGSSGQLVWKRNLIKDKNAQNIGWGFSSSPKIHNSLVIVNAGINGMAFNCEDGSDAWVNNGGKGGYAVPIFLKSAKNEYFAIFAEKALFIVDGAKGKEFSSFAWVTSYDINAADPLIVSETNDIFISSGYGKGCALIRLKGNKLEEVWRKTTIRSHFTSPILIGKHIYGVDGNAGGGNLVCIELASGNLKWKGKTGFGSLVAADNKLIFINEKGTLFVVEANPEAYVEIAKNSSGINATCWTMPVLCNGNLYCRNDKGNLVCLDFR